jgi:hypothetical protein
VADLVEIGFADIAMGKFLASMCSKTSASAATLSIIEADSVPSQAKLLSNWRCPA